MNINIKKLLTGPDFQGDEDLQRKVKLLHRLILSLAVLDLVIMANLALSPRGTPGILTALGISFFLTLLMTYSSARGMFKFSGNMTLVLLFSSLTVLILMLGTIRVMATLGYFILILLSGELFGKRGLVITTTAICLTSLGIIALEQHGLLPPPDNTVNIPYWINYAAFFILSAYLITFSATSLRMANKRAMAAMQELNENQAALLVKDKQYKLLAESTTDVIWLMDLATMKFDYVSPSVFRLRGYTPEEVMSQPVENALTPESNRVMQERMMVNLARLQSGQQVMNEIMELEQTRKDGTTVWTEVSASFILDEHGNPAQVIGITRDISDKRKITEVLRASEEKFSKAFHSSPDPIIIISAAEGRFIDVNESFLKSTGYSRAEVVGRTSVDIQIWPSEADREVLLNAIRDHGFASNLPAKFRRKDGEIRECIISTEVITLENGEKQLLSVVMDVTDQKQAEARLRASEEKFYKAFLSSPDSIIISNIVDGRYLEVNDSFLKDTGYTREEIIGFTSVDKEIWASAEDRLALVNELKEKGKIRNLDAQYKRKSGEIRDARISSEIIVLENGEKHLLSVVRDITEQKQAEDRLRSSEEKYRVLSSELETRVRERTAELAEANQSLETALNAKDEFLRVMSHELRTPLTGILGLSQALQLETFGKLTEKQMSTVTTIEENGNRLLRLINNVLDYSNLQGGKATVETREFSLDYLCSNIIRSFNSRLKEKNQKVSYHSNQALVLKTDEKRLHQVILELVSNATKFTPENGELGIEVNAKADDRLVSITVWDKGIGIPEKDLDKLFQPFFQLDSAMTRKYEGAGLGLPLAELNAGLIGGKISVTSEVGKGSRFTLTLPWQEN